MTKWQKMCFPFPSPLPSGRGSCAGSKTFKKYFPPDPLRSTLPFLSRLTSGIGVLSPFPRAAASHFAALPGQALGAGVVVERMEKWEKNVCARGVGPT